MFFSVIIPTYNRREILEETLISLFNQSVKKIDYEVIVVNDGSKDGTAAFLQEQAKKHKNLIVINQSNSGQGIARNVALDMAKGGVVVFLGDDTVPTHDFLFEHQKFHYLYPQKNQAVLGFTAWHPRLKLTSFLKWLTDGSCVLGRFGGHQFAYEKLHGKNQADFNFFYTSNISLKAELLKDYRFDTIFSKYGWEDIEFGYRLHQKEKLQIFYNPSALAYHYHPMTADSLPDRMFAIGKSAVIFDKKYPELGKVPKGFKYLLMRIATTSPIIWLMKKLSETGIQKAVFWYFYLLSKKFFLKGVKAGFEGKLIK